MTQQTSGARTAPAPPPNSFNANNLGYYLDGWADLITDQGAKVTAVRQAVAQILATRYPEKAVESQNGFISLSQPVRPYALTRNQPGATTTVYVGQRGQDLYISWRTFIKPVLSDLIAGLAIVTGILAFLVYLQIDSLSVAVISFIFLALAGVGLLAFASQVLKGNAVALFFKEPTVFDAEDITAMSLAAHKSILQALDKEGFDLSKLRLKQDFTAGRRNETI